MSREGEELQRAFLMWDSGSLCAVAAGIGVCTGNWEGTQDSRALVLFHLVNSVTLGRLGASLSLSWIDGNDDEAACRELCD